jgi:peroxiredoxin
MRGFVSPRQGSGEPRKGESTMISEGSKAPAFSLNDHLGRKVSLDKLIGKRHTMLFFYPLDWTPT